MLYEVITYVLIRCYINPSLGPPVPKEERVSWSQKFKLLLKIIAPAILVFLVLGTIFTGIAAPTEAAGVGAAGAIVLTALQRKLTWKGTVQAAENTRITSYNVCYTKLLRISSLCENSSFTSSMYVL